MKRNIIIIISFFSFIILVLAGILVHKQTINIEVSKTNKEIEKYTKAQITGTDLITLINKVIDKNENLAIAKDQDGKYVDDGINSIKIEIKFLEKDELVSMESINNLGINNFVKHYSTKKFKCIEIKYHNKTRNISYLKFEEV